MSQDCNVVQSSGPILNGNGLLFLFGIPLGHEKFVQGGIEPCQDVVDKIVANFGGGPRVFQCLLVPG